MKSVHLLPAVALLALAGCSSTSDYIPPANATSEDIFKTTCVSCHAPKGDHTFELSAEMNNADAIAKRITGGTMGMPAFHNIQGQVLVDLVAYVQSQSKPE